MRLKPEDKLQIDCINYLKLCYPQCVVFAIPNEGDRSVLGHQIAVAKGLLPGIHDICVLVPREFCEVSLAPVDPSQMTMWEPHFIELKTPKGKVSKAQVDLHIDFNDKDIKHSTCRSVDDVAKAMGNWGIKSLEKKAA